jgi:hypothetical protein
MQCQAIGKQEAISHTNTHIGADTSAQRKSSPMNVLYCSSMLTSGPALAGRGRGGGLPTPVKRNLSRKDL